MSKMTVNNIAAVMRTNLSAKDLKKGDDHKKGDKRDFLTEITKYLEKEFDTDAKNVTLEVQTDVLMMRAASSGPMMDMNLYHNCDKINQATKVGIAGAIAVKIAELLEKIPVERVLVLFFDTRKCT